MFYNNYATFYNSENKQIRNIIPKFDIKYGENIFKRQSRIKFQDIVTTGNIFSFGRLRPLTFIKIKKNKSNLIKGHADAGALDLS